ncbi:MAG: hypothetical protein WBX25_37100 [Rhodomicrobium sp.]
MIVLRPGRVQDLDEALEGQVLTGVVEGRIVSQMHGGRCRFRGRGFNRVLPGSMRWFSADLGATLA